MEDTVYSHPSYGMLRMSRFQGRSRFFAVEPELDGGVYLEIHTAEVHRHLNRDWIHSNKLVVRARMSSYQFAEAITNLNRGDGIPVTLQYIQGQEVTQYEPMPHQREKIDSEISQTTKELLGHLESLKAEVRALQEKKSASKKDLEVLSSKIGAATKVVSDSLPFIEKSFKEALDDQTHRAKVEFSAWVDNQVHQHGLAAIAQNQLPSG